jgi:hypothetical protein
LTGSISFSPYPLQTHYRNRHSRDHTGFASPGIGQNAARKNAQGNGISGPCLGQRAVLLCNALPKAVSGNFLARLRFANLTDSVLIFLRRNKAGDFQKRIAGEMGPLATSF